MSSLGLEKALGNVDAQATKSDICPKGIGRLRPTFLNACVRCPVGARHKAFRLKEHMGQRLYTDFCWIGTEK